MAWVSKEDHRETKFGTWLYPELNLWNEVQPEGGGSEVGGWDEGYLELLQYWAQSPAVAWRAIV